MKRKEFNVLYPSAMLLQSACYNDYKDLLDRYNRIYDKINIALGFCGAVVLVILGNFDYTTLLEWNCGLLMIAYILCSLVSSALIMWALIQLLLLTRSRSVAVFDSLLIRNDEIYRYPEDQAALWLIEKYTNVIVELKKIVDEKQEAFDSVLIKLVISITTYAVVIITQKGL